VCYVQAARSAAVKEMLPNERCAVAYSLNSQTATAERAHKVTCLVS